MKNLVSVAAVAFILYIFTFYVDGEMGVIIIAFILAAPLISLALALYGRNRIKVNFDCDSYVKKGNDIDIRVTVEKNGSLPLPLIEVVPSVSEVFDGDVKRMKLSMLSENKFEFSFSVHAVTGGNGEISINSVYSCGFLGFFRIKSKNKLPLPKSVGVIPVIPEVKASSQLFRSIADSVMTSENDDENDTSMLFFANTAPGYEHREYVNGDPLKRVNWKLSTKKSKLMVRLDEAASAAQPVIVLDLYRPPAAEIKESLVREERLIQSVFALVALLINQGIACTFVSRMYNGETAAERVDNPDYPQQLLLKVISSRVSDKRIDISQINENYCACIIASTDFSTGFSELISAFPDKENLCGLAPSCTDHTHEEIPIWYLDEDNNFKLV